VKLKGKGPRGRLRSRWEQQLRKDITQKEERERKLRRNGFGKRETDGQVVIRNVILQHHIVCKTMFIIVQLKQF
jgi:hypothetical protein